MGGAPPASQPNQRPEPAAPTREQLCAPVVRRLCEAYGWAILSEEALTARVLALAPPDAPPSALEQLARDQYNRALWEACREGADPERREAAYAELQRYLYRAAYNRRPELAEECVQRALELVFAQVERCREPGAFLTFALDKLRHALKEEGARVERLAPADQGPEPCTAPDAVAVAAELHERAATLLAAVARLRDPRQRHVVLLKFYAGLDDQSIGDRLGITPNFVRVLRHRALTVLRADPALAAWLADDP